MKKILVILIIILSWNTRIGADFGQSEEGNLATVTFSHIADCDSARVYFGYPSSNLYVNLKLTPMTADSSRLKADGLDLDSIGGHYAEIRYYERDAESVSGYVIGEWFHACEGATQDSLNALLTYYWEIHDSLMWAVRIVIDSLFDASIDTVMHVADLDNLIYFWGACDSCYYRLFPEEGQANKDSSIVINPKLGADSLVGKIIFKHGTVPSVYDTAYFYRAPWWEE